MATDKGGFPTLDIKAAKALRPNVHQIRIESILGGMSDLANFSGNDQFLYSVGIDPSAGNIGSANEAASGNINPILVASVAASTISNIPLWILSPHPKANSIAYVYDISGSAYTLDPRATPAVTALNDAGSLNNSTGNGIEYYDNYVYFAKNTTVTRYGPLNGSPSFDADYWGTTLSKTALTNNTTYPVDVFDSINYPNHVMHRHSDGKLYIADTTGTGDGAQGQIHYISTTRTSIEGDTDNGSKYGALTFGYGLFPTAIESYGSSLAIALFEGRGSANRKGPRAKLAFWDTTSSSFNSITWVEFPDPFISALKNIDGVLYIISGVTDAFGFRVSRYVGGNTVEEVFNTELGLLPFPGAVDGDSRRLLFGSNIDNGIDNWGCVFSYGGQKKVFNDKLFNIMKASPSVPSNVYSLALIDNFGFGLDYPVLGWQASNQSGDLWNGIDAQRGNGATLQNPGTVFWSQIYKIGQPFKITRIRIHCAEIINGSITPTLYFDNNDTSQALTKVSKANFPAPTNGLYSTSASIRPVNAIGRNNFFLELKWTAGDTDQIVVELPIIIEYELLDVD